MWQDTPDAPGFYWVSRRIGDGPGRVTTVAEVYMGPGDMYFADILGGASLPVPVDGLWDWKDVRWLRIEEPKEKP